MPLRARSRDRVGVRLERERVPPVAVDRSRRERVHPPADLEPEAGRAPVLVHRARELVLGCPVGQAAGTRRRTGARRAAARSAGSRCAPTAARRRRGRRRRARRTPRSRSGSCVARSPSHAGWWNIVAPAARPTKSSQRSSVRGSRSSVRIPAGYASGRCPRRVSARSSPAPTRAGTSSSRASPEGHVYQHSSVAAVPRGRVRPAADRALPPRTRRPPHRRAPARRDARRPAACGATRTVGARLSSLPRTPLAGPLAQRPAVGRRAARGRARARARAVGRAAPGKARGAPTSTGSSPGLAGAAWRASYVLALPDDRVGAAVRQLAQPRPDQVGRQQGGQGRGRVRIGRRRRRRPRLVSALPRNDARGGRPAAPAATLRGDVARDRAAADLMRLYVAEQRGGGMIAGSIVLGLGRTAFYAFNGRLSRCPRAAAERGAPVGGDP